MNKENIISNKRRIRPIDIMIAIIILGSLWGFLSELALNTMAIIKGLPYKGGTAGISIGLGIGIMGIAVGIFRNLSILPKGLPIVLLGIPFIAILSKLLIITILDITSFGKINPYLAILWGGLSLTGIVSIIGNKIHSSNLLRITCGMLAGFLAAGVFYVVGIQIMPCPYLLSFNNMGSFIISHGLVWSLISGILFNTGYLTGTALKKILVKDRVKPLFYYTASILLMISCWAGITFFVASAS
ncbi:MAG: hypothetical protein SVZ03_03045 [Spirochaetota bacterium]|nr:hypothetical protein [Spirochaetota bacterium]